MRLLSRSAAVAPVAALLLLAAPMAAQETSGRRNIRDNEILWTIRPLTAAYSWLFEGRFEDIAGICFDPVARELLVVDQAQGRAGMFTPDLFPKFSFGGRKVLRNPGHIAVDAEGRIYATFARPDAIRRFNYRGDWIGDLEVPGANGSVIISFLDLAPDGSLMVGDAQNGQVLNLDPESGAVNWRLGRKGFGKGRFVSPAGAAYSPDGNLLYVVERASPPATGEFEEAFVVQVFRAVDREYRFGWGKHADGGMNFSTPAALAVTPSGLIVICDTLQHSVKVFDSEGKWLFQFGGLGVRPGDTFRPVDLAMGENQILYVAERGGRRVQAFEFFTERRKEIPFGAPAGKADSLLGPKPEDLGPSRDPFGLLEEAEPGD